MKITVLGVHPDDIELGCGGTVALCVRDGHVVTLVDLTRGEGSSNGTPEQRAGEAEAAAAILGAPRRNLGLPDAGIVSEDVEQVAVIVSALRELRPNVVLIPSGDDPHPDHVSGAALVLRGLYLCGVHGFRPQECGEAWRVAQALIYAGRRDVEPAVVVDITDTFSTKLRAIEAHVSQFRPSAQAKRTPLNTEQFLSSVEARNRVAGHRIGASYGEAFATLNPIGLSSLTMFAGKE